jgi:hypothetical protein
VDKLKIIRVLVLISVGLASAPFQCERRQLRHVLHIWYGPELSALKISECRAIATRRTRL